MSDPLNNLKRSMKSSVLKDFSFSDDRKNAVKNALHGRHSQLKLQFWKEETVISLLESIQYEAKQGYDISTSLFQKDDLSFQNKEGQLYTLLHLLENKSWVNSKWIDGKKYYELSSKGIMQLAACKHGDVKRRESLRHLLEEVVR